MGKSVMVTGHRPKKLDPKRYGYNYNNAGWQEFENTCKDVLKNEGATEAVTGMALGCDTAFALAVLDMKDKGSDIKLVCAIPCAGQDAKWPASSKKLYHDILNKADEVVQVSDKPYSAKAMMDRNTYMVNRCDEAVALWDGQPSGGTADAVRSLRNAGKNVIRIDPQSGKVMTTERNASPSNQKDIVADRAEFRKAQEAVRLQYQRESAALYDARIASLAQWGAPVWADEDVLSNSVVMGNLNFDFYVDSEDSSVRFECFEYLHGNFIEHQPVSSGYIDAEDVMPQSDKKTFRSSLEDFAKQYIKENELDTGVKEKPQPGDEPYDGMEPFEAEQVLWYMRKESYAEPEAVESAINTNGIFESEQKKGHGSSRIVPFEHDDVMTILKSDCAESDFVPYVNTLDAISRTESRIQNMNFFHQDVGQELMDRLSDLTVEAHKSREHILNLIHGGVSPVESQTKGRRPIPDEWEDMATEGVMQDSNDKDFGE